MQYVIYVDCRLIQDGAFNMFHGGFGVNYLCNETEAYI